MPVTGSSISAASAASPGARIGPRRLAAFAVDYVLILAWIGLISAVGLGARSLLGTRLGTITSDRDKLIGHAISFLVLTLPVADRPLAAYDGSTHRPQPGGRATRGRVPADRRRDAARAAPVRAPPSRRPVARLDPADVRRLQRRVGNQAVLALLAGARVQRQAGKVDVPSGVFKAEHYEAMKPEELAHKVGAGIVLTFTPNFNIPGRIGLVQTIEKDTTPMRVDTDPLMKTLGKDQKWHDTVVTDSPVYAALHDPEKELKQGGPKSLADTANPKDTLSKVTTPAHKDVDEQKVAESSAYANAAGIVNPPMPFHKYQTGEIFGTEKPPEPAALTDMPGFAAGSEAAKSAWTWQAHVQALVLSGEKGGTYLGEVRWGWAYRPPSDLSVPTAATLAPEKVELVSEGAPSPKFERAAFDWNRKGVLDPVRGGKVDLAQLPLTPEAIDRLAKEDYRRLVDPKPSAPKYQTALVAILSVHEQSRSHALSDTERAVLLQFKAGLAERAASLGERIDQLQWDIEYSKRRRRAPPENSEENLAWYTKVKEDEARLATRVDALLTRPPLTS